MSNQKKESEFPHRRRPWLAVFLSLVMPGLGQIYCGDMPRGIAVILVMTLFPLGWVGAMMINKSTPIAYCFIMWGIVLLAIVFAVIDAYRTARRTRFDYPLRDYNHWGLYLALIWIAGAGTIGYTAMVRENMFAAYRVPSLSMAPTIAYNDRVIANKLAYRHKKPQRGDVVLFNQPDHLRGYYVKRIVALGGDTVEIRNGELWINDQVLEREWIEKKTITTPKESLTGDVYWEINGDTRYQIFDVENPSREDVQPDNFGPVTVPEYQCFVVGDNRKYSFDSRNFGTLSLGALKGKQRFIYWPPKHWATISQN